MAAERDVNPAVARGQGTSLLVVETDEVEGFERGRNLDKLGLKKTMQIYQEAYDRFNK